MRLLRSSVPYKNEVSIRDFFVNECEHEEGEDWFILPLHQLGYVIIDLGCPVQIKSLEIRNGQNPGHQK